MASLALSALSPNKRRRGETGDAYLSELKLLRQQLEALKGVARRHGASEATIAEALAQPCGVRGGRAISTEAAAVPAGPTGLERLEMLSKRLKNGGGASSSFASEAPTTSCSWTRPAPEKRRGLERLEAAVLKHAFAHLEFSDASKLKDFSLVKRDAETTHADAQCAPSCPPRTRARGWTLQALPP